MIKDKDHDKYKSSSAAFQGVYELKIIPIYQTP